MTAYRTETDLLGTREVPADALYGIHTVRALENFPLARRPVHRALVHAYGAVKLACARTNGQLGYLDDEVARVLQAACAELQDGTLDEHIVVDALQGGAGTSTNMNVNEVLANRALQLLDCSQGDYRRISPTEHVNLHQSTNDTYPTALKVAAIGLVRALEQEVVELVQVFQTQEQALAGIVKVGRTQLQDAVLTTVGRSMGAYAEAFGRDRWRIYKCEERLRVVNLGATAIGTGLGAPRDYIFTAIDALREITGIGLARAENLTDATQNADVFAEVSGILKAHAVNLLKVSGDLRLLSSGPQAGIGELHLPPRQAGSSIMPTKVNPVIPEAVSQAALRVMAHDQELTQACALGNLELNVFLPLVADALLSSLDLLIGANRILRSHCVIGLTANEEQCRAQIATTTATATALLPALGYKQAEDVVREAADTGQSIRAVVLARGLLTADEFDYLVTPEAVTRLGTPLRRDA